MRNLGHADHILLTADILRSTLAQGFVVITIVASEFRPYRVRSDVRAAAGKCRMVPLDWSDVLGDVFRSAMQVYCVCFAAFVICVHCVRMHAVHIWQSKLTAFIYA